MKHLILAAATLMLIHGADAREHRGPPPACPQPKADCCPKPCPPKPCKPKCKPEPKPCKPACPKPCEPCKPCPPVCFERGHPTDPCCTPAAYSEWAAIDLECSWDTFITANFIYWEAIQGGMDLAIPGQGTITAGSLTSAAPSAVGFELLKTEFEYKPGFQVGLGWRGHKDNWLVYAEYTWLHGTTHTSSESAPNPNVATVNGVALPQNGIWLPMSWLPNASNDISNNISSHWQYKIDLVDAQLSRPFYSGTNLTLEPFFGLRGAWIRQKLHLDATNLLVGSVPTLASPTRTAHYNSRSAAVGPRAGLNGNWLFCYGLRVEGNIAASLLFTGYDVHQNVQSPDATGTFQFPVKTKIHDLNVLRPNLDMSIGAGWGMYFCCRSFHWDIAATYDFNIFWEQNMMRYLADTVNAGTQASPSDLYLQGLTIKTQFDF